MGHRKAPKETEEIDEINETPPIDQAYQEKWGISIARRKTTQYFSKGLFKDRDTKAYGNRR
jgi:hypothetical protein